MHKSLLASFLSKVRDNLGNVKAETGSGDARSNSTRPGFAGLFQRFQVLNMDSLFLYLSETFRAHAMGRVNLKTFLKIFFHFQPFIVVANFSAPGAHA